MYRVGIALAIALLAVPVGAGVGQGAPTTDVVTLEAASTRYVQLVGFEASEGPDHAAIAGHVRCVAPSGVAGAVAWVREHFLVPGSTRDIGQACTLPAAADHVWAVREGAPDPRGNPTLTASEPSRTFTDPNGRTWIVETYRYHTLALSDGPATAVATRATWTTWVVSVGDLTWDPGSGIPYDFVVVVELDRSPTSEVVRLWLGPAPGHLGLGATGSVSAEARAGATSHARELVVRI